MPTKLPEITIPFQLVAQYSVALALVINTCGFVIAALNYSRLGVSPGALPLLTIWGAGLSYTVITVFHLHVGHAALTLARANSVEAAPYAMLVVMFGFVLAGFLLRRAGVFTYGGLCALVGSLWALGPPRFVPSITADNAVFPLPAFALIVLLVSLLLFTDLAYPNLSRALGGAAPSPVRVELTDGYAALIPPNARVHEVFSAGDSILLQLEFDEDSGVPKREDLSSMWIPVRNFDPPARYVSVPRSAFRWIEYLDTFKVAPRHRDVLSPPRSEGSLPPPPRQEDRTGASPTGKP